jgi:phosphate transport system substrate-binding protein
MTFYVIIAVIIVLLLCIIFDTKRQRITVLIGFGIGILSFFTFLIFLFFSPTAILWSLLLIFDVSIIAFLVLWNTKESQKIYLLLSVPVICIIIGIAVIGYYNYIHKIPTVDEQSSRYEYYPFDEDNLLAKLDEKPTLELIDNLPVLDGATALYPVYASFVQAVYPENEYKNTRGMVLNTGTSKAYDNLFEDKVDIIFCAEPSDLQLTQFYDNNINLKLIPIGREAFVFFVNKNNKIDNLTTENIQGIFSGKIKNWKELNGTNQRIRVFQRPKNSGSQTILEKIMGNTLIISPRRENVSSGMGDIINEVAVYRNFSNAIGYSFLYFTTEMAKNDQIKLLSINGIYPSKETIQNNSYPFSDSFYAIYVDNFEKNENIELFIEWILSKQGQTLISKTGYTPIKNEYPSSR